MFEKLLKEIKLNKLKIIFFILGYFMLVFDYKMMENIEIIFTEIDKFYLIIFNLIFIYITFHILKKIAEIYINIIIIKSEKLYIKIFKYLKIISLGAFIGFISLIFQVFVMVLLPF